jgi:hypothetical protein
MLVPISWLDEKRGWTIDDAVHENVTFPAWPNRTTGISPIAQWRVAARAIMLAYIDRRKWNDPELHNKILNRTKR